MEDVCWEEVEAQREVGGGEDGEGLDEGVGDGLVAGEVGVELVAGEGVLAGSSLPVVVAAAESCMEAREKATVEVGSDRANNNTSLDWRDSISGVLQVFDNMFYTSFGLPLLPSWSEDMRNKTYSFRSARFA